MMKYVSWIFLSALIILSCQKVNFDFSAQADDFFFLKNDKADMPVWVQGNTQSKVFVLMLHGGPGGSAFTIDGLFPEFVQPLEEKYALVYWEQRSSGAAQGDFSLENLSPQQYVEDLEKLIVLLKAKYSPDIQIFLMGISWGGYLGNMYLTKGDNQFNISGWINIVGPDSFLDMANVGRQKLLDFSTQQINLGRNIPEWQEINNWCLAHDPITSVEDFLIENGYANQADFLMADSLDVTIEQAPLGEQLSFIFSSPFSSSAWLSNMRGIRESNLIEKILMNEVDCEGITIPSVLIGGKFDFVVPPEILQNQFEAIHTTEKELHILPHSGHGLIGHETRTLNDIIITFVEEYR